MRRTVVALALVFGIVMCGVAIAQPTGGSAATQIEQPSALRPFQIPTAPSPETIAMEQGSGSAAAEPAHASKESTKEGTLFAIKLIAGLIGLMVLAYLGGHRSVVRFQERLGIGGVVTAGFPFVALGALASHDSIGVLNDDVISRLRPVLHFGLGWLGFII